MKKYLHQIISYSVDGAFRGITEAYDMLKKVDKDDIVAFLKEINFNNIKRGYLRLDELVWDKIDKFDEWWEKNLDPF